MNKVFRTIFNISLIFIILLLYEIFSYYFDNKSTINFKKDIYDKQTINVSNNNLSITFFDVGQGDSTLVCHLNECLLIDAGSNNYGQIVVNKIKELGIFNLKYVVATHSHEDHIGGMDNVINSFYIEHFYIPNIEVNTKSYYDVIAALENKKVSKETPNIHDTFQIGNILFEVLSIKNECEDLNDSSIVLKAQYINTSYIFMGDATKEIELEILNQEIKSDVLKVGHHGSKQSSSAQFLSKVKPKYAIISVGKSNDFNHPRQVTLNKLEKINAEIYRTDLNGDITLTSDGKSINIETEKQ